VEKFGASGAARNFAEARVGLSGEHSALFSRMK